MPTQQKLVILIMLYILALNAHSAGKPEETGSIALLQIHKNPDSNTSDGNRFIVRLSGTISENSCGTDSWTGYLDSEAGRAQYSAILAASAAGKDIKLEGTAADRCQSGNLLLRNVYFVW